MFGQPVAQDMQHRAQGKIGLLAFAPLQSLFNKAQPFIWDLSVGVRL